MKSVGLFLKIAGLAAGVSITILWVTIYFVGPVVDSYCVIGRISEDQALTLNAQPWGHCPTYHDGECVADKNDRVVARECSDLLREIFLR